jgi:hypothetical protein
VRGIIANTAETATGYYYIPISWMYPLATAPTVEVTPTGTTTAHCGGNIAMPEAAPGYVCVYYDATFNTPAYDSTATESPLLGAVFHANIAAPSKIVGSWAVSGD